MCEHIHTQKCKYSHPIHTYKENGKIPKISTLYIKFHIKILLINKVTL